MIPLQNRGRRRKVLAEMAANKLVQVKMVLRYVMIEIPVM
jgi:hypothetical protein